MIESQKLKNMAYDLGADLCGIASIDRFDLAPEGFHPSDVLPSCKSVIALAKKFPAGTIFCTSQVPYTVVRNILSDEMDKLAVRLCSSLEDIGIIAVPTGTISPTLWDPKTRRNRNAVSAKHAAAAAGSGRIGKNTMLVTPEYGNMVWLTVVLCSAELAPDEIVSGSPCPQNCSVCVDNCPVNALGNPEMNQQACWDYAFHVDEGQPFIFKCNKCRTMCPNCLGIRNRVMKIQGN